MYRSILFFGLMLIGCTDKIQIAPKGVGDAVTPPLHIALADGLQVKESKREIVARLDKGLPVSYSGVTEVLLEDHYKNWVERHLKARNPSFKQVLSTFRSLAAPFASDELPQIKTEIETRAGEFGYAQKIVYNARAVSVIDAPYDKRVQSYSGTLLFLLSLRRSLGAERMAKENLVVIFESGHLLPGYVVKENEQWTLYGMETSAAGPGLVSYGPLTQAGAARMLRVVDADLFLWVELYKFEAINLLELANQALELTARKFSVARFIPLEDTFVRKVDPLRLDWTPFSLGSPDNRDLDRERQTLVEALRSELPGESPNLTIQHANNVPTAEPTPPAIEKAIMNPYPFRQVPSATSGELITQCWDYIKQTWVDVPHRREGKEFFIRFNPCAYSKVDYEPVPYPLALEPVPTPPPYSLYQDDEDWDDGF